jgi:hypothetical protein
MRSDTISYSEEIADQILEHIENWGTIASACKLERMPSPSTLRRWRRGEGAKGRRPGRVRGLR